MAQLPEGFIPDAAPAASAAAAVPQGFIADERPPDFKAANAKDAAGNAQVDPNTIGTFARHLWQGINPVQLGQMLPWPKALGGSGVDHPLLHVVDQALAVKHKADEAWAKGDHVTAAAKYVESLIPLLGPMMSDWGDKLQAGKYAAVAGGAAGLAGGLAEGELVSAALPKPVTSGIPGGNGLPANLPRAGGLTAEEQAANAFAQARGVPLDAATATGNPFVRGVQKISGESMLGSVSAGRGRAAQASALERVGEELAADVHPSAVTPEQAGAGVVGSIRRVMADLHKQANEAYGKVRAAERTAEPDIVPKAEDAATLKARETRQYQSIGYVPDPKAIAELNGILDEMENLPYQAPTWTDLSTEPGLNEGNAGGGKYNKSSGGGGAEVFHDIRESTPSQGTVNATRGEVIGAIRSALETGKYTGLAKGALSVAERRASGNLAGLSQPVPFRRLGGARVSVEPMQMAVDLSDVQSALRPTFDRLSRENAIAPLQGGKADALRALDRVLNAPKHVPMSDAEAALSDLKSLARSDDPLLRSAAQGVAAKAVKELGDAVEMRAAAAGDEVIGALKEGRAATRAKYQAGDVLDRLKAEPVQLFRQMTAPKDTGVELLRQVQEFAPERMPEVGRAKLEEWLEMATERGRFDHADKLYAEWNKLGPETKRILFGNAESVSNLDKFFLLAKRIAENPNPSGTAGTAIKSVEVTAPIVSLASINPMGAVASVAGSIGMGGLAKLLYSPRGVKAITRLLESDPGIAVRAGRKPVGRAVSQAALIDLAAAAKSVGVPLQATLPQAADRNSRQ
jgi:hypothetical protein